MSDNNQLCAIILAAGNGKRMKSQKPKVLCEVLFKPMISWVSDWCQKAEITDLCAVVALEGEGAIRPLLSATAEIRLQRERRGTGHAVMQAVDFLQARRGGDVLVLNGDAPFIDDETIRQSFALHKRDGCAVTVVTAAVDDPTGYGRIVRSQKNVSAIVEHADADDTTREIREINSGTYWFSVNFLLDALQKLDCDNAQGEYYLTDTVRLAVKAGGLVRAFCSPNKDIVLGANDRRGLLKLTEIARSRVLERLMDEGVDVVCADGVLISPDAQIAPDVTIYPGVIIKGRSVIGAGSVITSGSLIEESTVGAGSTINASQIYHSRVGDGVTIGPFSQLRPGCVVENGVKIGDFVELKNSHIGEKTSVSHLTYVGDSDVGARVNFGCGVVTVNYNGLNKFRTAIADDAFIGCNTNLVAPVKVGQGAYTAAGSTITQDVPDGALAIARERQTNKDDWAKNYLRDKKKK